MRLLLILDTDVSGDLGLRLSCQFFIRLRVLFLFGCIRRIGNGFGSFGLCRNLLWRLVLRVNLDFWASLCRELFVGLVVVFCDRRFNDLYLVSFLFHNCFDFLDLLDLLNLLDWRLHRSRFGNHLDFFFNNFGLFLDFVHRGGLDFIFLNWGFLFLDLNWLSSFSFNFFDSLSLDFFDSFSLDLFDFFFYSKSAR